MEIPLVNKYRGKFCTVSILWDFFYYDLFPIEMIFYFFFLRRMIERNIFAGVEFESDLEWKNTKSRIQGSEKSILLALSGNK